MADNVSDTWMLTFASRLTPQVAGTSFAPATSTVLSRLDGLASGTFRAAVSGRSVAVASEEFARRPDDGETERAETRARQRVLDEDLFTSALIRERQRADRFDEAFAVVTIAIRPAELSAVVSAMTAAMRTTDLLGWVEQGRVLGVMLAGVVDPTDGVAGQIEARMQRELACSLPPRAVAQLEMRWYVHTAPGHAGAEGLADADPLWECILANRARRSARNGLKRCFDVVGSGILMLLLLPVFLIVAAMLKLTSSGPVFFRQTRVGELAKPFTMLKFRTMYVNNDAALHRAFVTQFINSSLGVVQDAGPAPFKIQNDPRITVVGRLLRRTSLDELPQLWNVFRGDMSLVGPRPPLRYELDQYRSWHWRRVLEAKPGMTGLWQVTGRSRTTFDEMVRLDLRYVRTQSFWTDIRILLATPRAVIGGKGAC